MSKQCSKCDEVWDDDYFYKGRICKRCHNFYNHQRRKLVGRKETPEQARKWNMKAKFGITPEEYDVMLNKQNGVCAICSNTCRSGRRLAIDHCHKTGKIRGLLCGECNNGIGKLKDDPSLLRKAITYLEIGMEE